MTVESEGFSSFQFFLSLPLFLEENRGIRKRRRRRRRGFGSERRRKKWTSKGKREERNYIGGRYSGQVRFKSRLTVAQELLAHFSSSLLFCLILLLLLLHQTASSFLMLLLLRHGSGFALSSSLSLQKLMDLPHELMRRWLLLLLLVHVVVVLLLIV